MKKISATYYGTDSNYWKSLIQIIHCLRKSTFIYLKMNLKETSRIEKLLANRPNH